MKNKTCIATCAEEMTITIATDAARWNIPSDGEGTVQTAIAKAYSDVTSKVI